MLTLDKTIRIHLKSKRGMYILKSFDWKELTLHAHTTGEFKVSILDYKCLCGGYNLSGWSDYELKYLKSFIQFFISKHDVHANTGRNQGMKDYADKIEFKGFMQQHMMYNRK